MSTLTLVRHGQASYMETDYDKLSPLGEQQARKLGEYWARHRITVDRVFHGPAKRPIRTMEIVDEVLKTHGLTLPDPQPLPEFDEFDAFTVMRIMTPRIVENNTVVARLWNDFNEQKHTPEAGRILQKLFEEIARIWCSGEYDTPEVESWAQFRSRVGGALDGIRSTAAPSTHTAVFTSGGPIAATIAYTLGLTPQQAIEFVWLSRNCSYSQFVFTGDRFSMHAFNAIPHLDDLKLFTYR